MKYMHNVTLVRVRVTIFALDR